MNKEEIKVIIKDCVYSEEGITYMSDKQYNNYIDIIEQLLQENQKLKKELEEERNKVREYSYKLSNFRCEETYENQQKEFIEWLTNEKNIYPYDISDYVYEDIINTILSKYNEIIEK